MAAKKGAAKAAPKAGAIKAGAPSFDSIIEAERLDRKKKENQTLADQLLGSKSRRASAPGAGIGNKKAPAERSLASRIGVTKRSASTSAKPKPSTIATKRSAPVGKRLTREDRIKAMVADEKEVNLNHRDAGISIKGSGSGPYVVMARNFAPGTNAADIEAALEPVAGHIVGVHITTFKPYVSAQIACAEKWGADAIVARFNGQKADGRVLSLAYKGAGPAYFKPPPGARDGSNSYDAFREQADRERRENRKADPQHGRGLKELDDRRKRGNGLYSDEMMVDTAVPASQRGRGFR